MESLAALVAVIFIAEIAISLANIFTAILYRRGKAKLWLAAGFIAMWGIATVWTLAVAPLASIIIASILITMPKKNRAE